MLGSNSLTRRKPFAKSCSARTTDPVRVSVKTPAPSIPRMSKMGSGAVAFKIANCFGIVAVCLRHSMVAGYSFSSTTLRLPPCEVKV